VSCNEISERYLKQTREKREQKGRNDRQDCGNAEGVGGEKRIKYRGIKN
jgi:hypothetical protein